MGVMGEAREFSSRGNIRGEPAVGLRLEWVGVDDVLARLTSVQPRLVARCLKPAIDKAGRMVARAMKSAMRHHKRTGLLKQSIGIRVSPKWRTGRVYAVIGPRRSFKKGEGGAKVSRKWRAKKDLKRPQNAGIVPTRYAHLVEFGHAKGAGKSAAKPYPFMRPATASTKRAAEQLAAQELRRTVSRLLT